MRLIILVLGILCAPFLKAQYPPAAGQPGSTAISKDSSIFVDWVKSCSIQRGWRNIQFKDSGFATVGDTLSPVGKPMENGVLSLGDSGVVICQFNYSLRNGPGWDFAVFENSFLDNYLELAFVEVSSDGRRYFRFPCHSLSDTIKQTGPFDLTDPRHINNLAGKYVAGYGTPFDIDELPDYKDLNKNDIRFVKLVDVCGSLNPAFAGYDTANRKINDPWPTPFPSSGFDLDAIGVINNNSPLKLSYHQLKGVKIIASNPLNEGEKLLIDNPMHQNIQIEITDIEGHLLLPKFETNESYSINAETLKPGMFFISIIGADGHLKYKGIRL
jgi:hypothetical protein